MKMKHKNFKFFLGLIGSYFIYFIFITAISNIIIYRGGSQNVKIDKIENIVQKTINLQKDNQNTVELQKKELFFDIKNKQYSIILSENQAKDYKVNQLIKVDYLKEKNGIKIKSIENLNNIVPNGI